VLLSSVQQYQYTYKTFVLLSTSQQYHCTNNTDVLTVCGPPKKEQQHCGNYSQFLICHRNVTKQTNPLQVHCLISYKFVVILEASGRILNIHVSKFLVLRILKIFKNIRTSHVITSSGGQGAGHIVVWNCTWYN
jgi:hypothetical protein